MAARLAQPAQGGGAGGGAGGSPVSENRDLIVIPATPNSIHLQHAIHQVSNTVVEVVNGDSSGQSSPNADQHHYITVAGENGVGYHVQYVEPQDIYQQSHQTHMDPLRAYPVYAVGGGVGPVEGENGGGEAGTWGGGADSYAYGVVVAADEARSVPDAPRAAASPAPALRTPPATVTWLLDNYETAEGVSLPRSTLYAHYLRHCATHNLEPVNAASFGKLIRSVFVGLRTRRLGTRGNSKYHYYGIRAKATSPLANATDQPQDAMESETEEKCAVARNSQEPRAGSDETNTGPTNVHRHHLGVAAPPEVPPLELTGPMPVDISPAELTAFRRQYADHCSAFLESVASLELSAVERSRREFWRRAQEPDDERESTLPRRKLYKLAARKDIAAWLRRADLELYQRAVELLLPDVLRPIPSALTQSIRNFAKTLESALAAATTGIPAASARASADAASALAAALRRYTSLNHLAQAARAVLHNSHQIHQMLTDLNRVDFRVVREQAAWACACGGRGGGAAQELEADFKATLGRGASLEQWAAWLERAVRGALAPHERRPDYASRARRFLLDWSFYSSLVIRELTLRSAASFGSFHLIRLLYDEYVAYLVERRVAAHERTPPIAVMQQAQEGEAEEEEDEEEDEWDWEDADGDVEGDVEGEGELDDEEPVEKKMKLSAN